MRRLPKLSHLISAIPLSIFCQANAQQANLSLDLQASGAYIQESVLVVGETDAISHFGDQGLNADIQAGLSAQLRNGFDLEIHYTWNDTRYQQASDFALNLQIASSSVGYRFGKSHLSWNGMYANAQLDGADYLAVRQISTAIGRTLGQRWYFHGVLGLVEREYPLNPDMNVHAPLIHLESYRLFNGMRHYFALYYKGWDEDAERSTNDIAVNRLGLRWSRSTPVLGRIMKSTIAVAQERQTTARGPEVLWDARADLELDMSERIFAKALYGYLQNQSNEAAFRYEQHRLELRLGVRW